MRIVATKFSISTFNGFQINSTNTRVNFLDANYKKQVTIAICPSVNNAQIEK